MDLQQFEAVLEAKHDLSWERYQEGWIDIIDRYDMTAALVRGPKVLDIGCAQGVLGWLLGSRVEYTGVDASPTMVDRARGLFGLDIRLAYAEHLPFEAGEFDTIVMGQVLEHVLDDRAAACEALRVLKIKGRLIVHVPATDTGPHGNHLRAFLSVDEMMELFKRQIHWMGWGRVHHYWYAWGEKVI